VAAFEPIALRIGERGTIYLCRGDLQRIIFRPGPRNIHETMQRPAGGRPEPIKKLTRARAARRLSEARAQFARMACGPSKARLPREMPHRPAAVVQLAQVPSSLLTIEPDCDYAG